MKTLIYLMLCLTLFSSPAMASMKGKYLQAHLAGKLYVGCVVDATNNYNFSPEDDLLTKAALIVKFNKMAEEACWKPLTKFEMASKRVGIPQALNEILHETLAGARTTIAAKNAMRYYDYFNGNKQ